MDEKELNKLIKKWLESPLYLKMCQGRNYYTYQNDVINREFFLYTVDEIREIDKDRANTKIPCSFLSILVDQKVSYCLSNDVVINNFNSVIDINEEIDHVAEEASIKTVGWLYVYVNEFGEVKSKAMESENIIPIYDGTIENKLIKLVRLYMIDKEAYAELWTIEGMILYKKDNDGDKSYKQVSTRSHLDNNLNWGAIPFVPLYNNRYELTDLEGVKGLIDAYDITVSDFSNNFVDFQELIMVVTNYAENVSTPAAAVELMNWLKKYKIINVREDGKLDILSKEIPHQGRSEFLSILKKLIFLFGKGVDMDELKGGSLTNVAIEAHFSGLDMKSNKFIKQCKKYVKSVLQFTNLYNKLKNNGNTQNVNGAEIIFNKATLINLVEIIESCVKSEGILSKRTIASNHPWCDDPDEELKQMAEDELKYGVDNNDSFNTGDDI